MRIIGFFPTIIAVSTLFSALIFLPAGAQVTTFDGDKPAATFNSQYSQTFNTAWNSTVFYGQWNAMEPNIFTASDIAAGYLQFVWIAKRVIYSKKPYVSPFIIQTDIDYSAGSSRGGVVIRANPGLPDQLQEPASGDPGFNREGIAFYPSLDGTSMTVQFTGPLNGDATPVTRIQVPKPAGVTNLRDRGTLRIEDFGTAIYIYFNAAPFIRIELGGRSGNLYSSGTVYTSGLQVAGTFTGMEVEVSGKATIAQRDASLRLYGVTINYNDLIQQTITFDQIGKKLMTDPPFTVSASASSGLPVEIKLVSGPATLVDHTITLTGQPGIVTLSATQSGNSVYYSAPEILRSFYVSDPDAVNVSPTSQDYVDNWVVTDGLGRQLPSNDEVGSKRNDKQIGVFYYIWHGFHGDKVYDITKIIANYPSDPLSAGNPGWGGPGAFHFWGEPENGYYRSEDPWVLRRDLQMLSNAHVDFIFIDVTNAYTYLETVKKLCEISMQMRKEGIYTPQLAFTTNARSGQIMNNLYDEFYAPSFYDELWFKWNGKPLILGDFKDIELRADVKSFFTIKYCWAWTNTKNEPNHWQWLDTYPQDYGWSVDPGTPEQIVVSVAQHPMSTTGNSYRNTAEPPVNSKYLTDFTGQGLHFAEQWTRAQQVDPPVIMVTQWNEWTAQRFIWNSGSGIYAGRPIKDGDSYFVDVFTEEFNRDMAPMKGGHTDNYYYQLISNIRKYKGMTAPQVFSAPVTISIDGDVSDWNPISPVFKDPPGDVLHRNYKGYDPTMIYSNNTGRNDIIESRATFDENNLYFYVKTALPLTPSTDPNWMLLFIDADRNKGTGWEGFDFVVNYGVKSSKETTLKQWDGKNWTNEKSIVYAINGDALELSIPRNQVLLDKATPEFYFHWADNPQHLNDISAFFTDGESAPDRRFNFNFSTSKIVSIQQSSFKILTIPGIVEFEDFDNGGAGVAYSDATIGNSGGAYRSAESVDIEPKTGGGYQIGWVNSGEWLEYSVDVKAIGKFQASIHYAATTSDNEAVFYLDGTDKAGIIDFPATGSEDTWLSKDIEMQLTAGRHVIKFLIKNGNADFKLDNIEFTATDVVYPGDGTGLSKSFWTASAGGRTWFQDSVCFEIDSLIDEKWADVGPGCGIAKDFWNVRWEGKIEPLYTETYTFYLTVNDMGRLWINNQLVIDGWVATSSGKTITGTIALTAGQKVPIKVDFAEKTGDAYIKFEWSCTSNPREVVPASQLYPLKVTDGISQIVVEDFNIYPNPATYQLTVNSGRFNIDEIAIMDIQGRVVYVDNKPFSGIRTIDISLEKGVYFIRFKGETAFPTKKFIVN